MRRADGTQERAVDYVRPEHLRWVTVSGADHCGRVGPQEYLLTFTLVCSWPEGKQPLTSLEFRAVQLEMRLAEVTETLRVLERLNSGEGGDIARLNRRQGRNSQVDEWLPAWRDRLDLTDDITMAGHSFGGATTVSSKRAHVVAILPTDWYRTCPDPSPACRSYCFSVPARNRLGPLGRPDPAGAVSKHRGYGSRSDQFQPCSDGQ